MKMLVLKISLYFDASINNMFIAAILLKNIGKSYVLDVFVHFSVLVAHNKLCNEMCEFLGKL